MTVEIPCPRKRGVSASVIVTLVCSAILPASIGWASQASASNPTLAKTRKIAEAQHEIVMLLIQKKEFAKATSEAAKIFELNWPPDQEPMLLKELLYFADQFLHNGQAALGLQLLEASLKPFRAATSLAAIWKEKGYLHKAMKNMDKALDCFREAQRLEKTSP